jgi:serine/threonine-protein kinase
VTDYFRDRLAAALAATYRIDDELVGGGMSRVFAATEQALGRKVVIKVLPPELSAGVNRERFQREIQVAAQLQHPHIVPLLSAGRIPPDSPTTAGSAVASEGELLYYTMPFIEGESLRAAIARRGRLPVRDVVRILHDVVEALAYAHSRGVVHRDIKPGNILTIGSHALVTDFGVAKALSAAMPVSGMTSAGMAIGTPAYMAPEQLAADPAADHRIDIYAVGLLAYELLSGKSPFVGTSPQATMAAQLTRVPDPLDTLRDDVPPALSGIITRCLEKLPENRPQTATALLDELDGVATPAGGGAAATAALPASAPAQPKQRRAVLAGALLVVAAAIAVAVTSRQRARQTGPAQAANVSAAPASATAPVGGVPGAAAIAGAVATGDSTARAPIVLSRAESLAIADAVRKRITARRDSQVAKGERALADSLSLRFERALSDSLSRIMADLRGGRRVEVRGFDPKEMEQFRDLARRAATVPNAPPTGLLPGAPTGARPFPDPNAPPTVYRVAPGPGEAPPVFPPPAPGVRRVLVGTIRTSMIRRDLTGVGVVIADSLKRAIVARPGYEVIDAASLTDPRLNRSRSALARAVGAGAVLQSLYFPRPDSLVVLQLQLFDVQRNRVMRVVESKPIDVKNPLNGLDDLIAGVVAALDVVEWRPANADSSAVKPVKP